MPFRLGKYVSQHGSLTITSSISSLSPFEIWIEICFDSHGFTILYPKKKTALKNNNRKNIICPPIKTIKNNIRKYKECLEFLFNLDSLFFAMFFLYELLTHLTQLKKKLISAGSNPRRLRR
jgi:hypothetical protein